MKKKSNGKIIKSNGFSLLEVLVALAVIGIGMSAALSVTNNTIDSHTEIEKRTYGNWMAENLIAELKLKGAATPGVLEGDENMAGREWYWRADITTTFDDDVLLCRMIISLSKQFDEIVADQTSYLMAASI